jgi:hypothetical protein
MTGLSGVASDEVWLKLSELQDAASDVQERCHQGSLAETMDAWERLFELQAELDRLPR